jgi:hypothetical protein
MFPVILAAAALKGMTGCDEEHIHPTNKAMGQLKVNRVAGRVLDGVRMPGSQWEQGGLGMVRGRCIHLVPNMNIVIRG